jgi:hypothetical protein
MTLYDSQAKRFLPGGIRRLALQEFRDQVLAAIERARLKSPVGEPQ